MQNGCFEWMKTMNRATILNMIRLYSPISRAEIAKKTNIAPPTVTNIVLELMDEGMVLEGDLGESTGGRKPIMLQLDSSRYRVIGITLQEKNWEVAIADLSGKMVHHYSKKMSLPVDEQHFLFEIKTLVEEIVHKLKEDQKIILGIGITTAGRVNAQEGTLLSSQLFPLSHVPIKQFLEEMFQLPVEVENDIQALALAESWYGQGKDVANFVCIHVGQRVGAGIVLDYQLYRGEKFAAGEIGHLSVDSMKQCTCGRVGCLEALVSGPAILEQVKHALLHGACSSTLNVVEDLEQLTESSIYQAAKKGDILVKQVLKDVGYHLGKMIDHIIRFLNPSRVILHGSVFEAGDAILNSLYEVIDALDPDFKSSVVVSKFGVEALVMGAYTLVLDKLYVPAIVKKHKVINNI